MEISQASIQQSPPETKTKLSNDLMRLLQVREKNEGMAEDWILFMATTPKFSALRPGEVYQAFKMAMTRDLLDYENDGKEFNLLPELSINMTSKILISYIAYKKTNPEYQSAKEDLFKLNQPTGPSDEERLQIREEFLLSTYNDIVNNGHCADAWLLYDELSEKLTQDNEQKKNLYKQQEFIYLQELKNDAIKNSGRRKYEDIYTEAQKNSQQGKRFAVVQNRCRAIMVSNYLKQFKKDYQLFKKAINGTTTEQKGNPAHTSAGMVS